MLYGLIKREREREREREQESVNTISSVGHQVVHLNVHAVIDHVFEQVLLQRVV